MPKIKTSDLIDLALDVAVAKCKGGTIRTENGCFLNQGDGYEYFTPSTDWAQGGPIIERECIGLLPSGNAYYERNGGTYYSYGPTPLIAAMRCYVASKLGDTVDVPAELL